MNEIPPAPESFTTDWFEHALGAPAGSLAAFSFEPIGTGQIADSYRVVLDWREHPHNAPASLVAKCPSPDETSLASARLMNLYRKEVNWYRELAPQSTVSVPACYHSELNAEGDRFALLLEDCAPGRQGDQLAGASMHIIKAALDEAARLHAPFMNSAILGSLDWLIIDPEMAAMRRGFISQFWPAFRERYQDRLSEALFEMGDAFIEKLAATEEDPVPATSTLVHGDFRIDNMLFGRPDGRAVVLDWQTLYPGHPLSDVSYLVGTSVADPDQRRSEERGLVEYYCERMAALGSPLDTEAAWTAYRQYASSGFVMAITASMLAKRTERGDEMFAVMAERPARQMMDLDTLSLM